MARINLWNKSLPRIELDHRARDARLQLARVERLAVPRASVTGLWLSPFVRLLGSRAGAAAEAVAGATGRKAIRASAVCPKSGGIGSKSVASVIEKPRPREENAESY
jgi:hypothetical protein